MKQHELQPPDGAHRKRRRVGRGYGSGRGKTAGAGSKGQKARSGGSVPPYFEGGQLPLVRKLPYRRGFKNPFRVEYAVVNVGQLEWLEAGAEVTPESLRAGGLVGKRDLPVKVLAAGTLTKALKVQAHAFSASAQRAIEAVGGSVALTPTPSTSSPIAPPERGSAPGGRTGRALSQRKRGSKDA